MAGPSDAAHCCCCYLAWLERICLPHPAEPAPPVTASHPPAASTPCQHAAVSAHHLLTPQSTHISRQAVLTPRGWPVLPLVYTTYARVGVSSDCSTAQSSCRTTTQTAIVLSQSLTEFPIFSQNLLPSCSTCGRRVTGCRHCGWSPCRRTTRTRTSPAVPPLR